VGVACMNALWYFVPPPPRLVRFTYKALLGPPGATHPFCLHHLKIKTYTTLRSRRTPP
jgi:hypothetical protein